MLDFFPSGFSQLLESSSPFCCRGIPKDGLSWWIFIFSIVLGAECLSYLKSIETHARAFSRLISDGISGVEGVIIKKMDFNPL